MRHRAPVPPGLRRGRGRPPGPALAGPCDRRRARRRRRPRRGGGGCRSLPGRPRPGTPLQRGRERRAGARLPRPRGAAHRALHGPRPCRRPRHEPARTGPARPSSSTAAPSSRRRRRSWPKRRARPCCASRSCWAGASAPAPRPAKGSRHAIAAGRRLRLYTDQYRTPVDPESVADAIHRLLERSVAGRLHLGGPERLSRYDLGRRVARVLGLPAHAIEAATQAEPPGAPPSRRHVARHRPRAPGAGMGAAPARRRDPREPARKRIIAALHGPGDTRRSPPARHAQLHVAPARGSRVRDRPRPRHRARPRPRGAAATPPRPRPGRHPHDGRRPATTRRRRGRRGPRGPLPPRLPPERARAGHARPRVLAPRRAAAGRGLDRAAARGPLQRWPLLGAPTVTRRAEEAARDLQAAASPSPAAAGWPLFRGDPARTGARPAAVAAARLRPVWRLPAGAVVASPVLTTDLVIVPATDGRLLFVDRAARPPPAHRRHRGQRVLAHPRRRRPARRHGRGAPSGPRRRHGGGAVPRAARRPRAVLAAAHRQRRRGRHRGRQGWRRGGRRRRQGQDRLDTQARRRLLVGGAGRGTRPVRERRRRASRARRRHRRRHLVGKAGGEGESDARGVGRDRDRGGLRREGARRCAWPTAPRPGAARWAMPCIRPPAWPAKRRCSAATKATSTASTCGRARPGSRR